MKKIGLMIIALIGFGFSGQAQKVKDHIGLAKDGEIKNMRAYDKNGLNVFEPAKDTTSTSNDVYLRLGGAFALQFQALTHENSGQQDLFNIGNNFNLATANLNIDVRLYDGVNLNLVTYLSSRHHPEPYVKGGYITIDKLNFIKEGFLEDVMDKVTLKFGHMENNYGDAHFRRSDNAQTMYNPFVGNYIMDGFMTEVGAEIYYRNNGWLAMVGMTNGRLNQNAASGTSPSTMVKLGYDKQVNEDLRLRLTGSVYHTAQSEKTWLYSGDRAGSRYYYVMEMPDASSAGNFTSGRFDPGMNNKLTAFMINPFVKYQGLEWFSTLEFVKGKNTPEIDTRDAFQFATDLIYRFGNNDDFYVGGRYNLVDADLASGEDVKITRFNFGGGMFLTDNIMMKVEYVQQKYDGFDQTPRLHEGKFKGVVLEAAISF